MSAFAPNPNTPVSPRTRLAALLTHMDEPTPTTIRAAIDLFEYKDHELGLTNAEAADLYTALYNVYDHIKRSEDAGQLAYTIAQRIGLIGKVAA